MAITLEPVVPSNRQQTEEMEVYPEQVSFIESVSECMEEADQLDLWRPVRILADNEPVGFSMYGFFPDEQGGRLWFDRLLIDRHHQGKGLGRQAIPVILSRMRREYPPQDIYLSVYSPNRQAIHLYEHFGFRFTGELDTKGERIMVLRANTALPG